MSNTRDYEEIETKALDAELEELNSMPICDDDDDDDNYDDDNNFDDYERCYMCIGYGNDYYEDEDGNWVNFCPECPFYKYVDSCDN